MAIKGLTWINYFGHFKLLFIMLNLFFLIFNISFLFVYQGISMKLAFSGIFLQCIYFNLNCCSFSWKFLWIWSILLSISLHSSRLQSLTWPCNCVWYFDWGRTYSSSRKLEIVFSFVREQCCFLSLFRFKTNLSTLLVTA